METLNKVQMLNTFLAKVKQLRGFGDMNSYFLASQFKGIDEKVKENQVNEIISEFSSPETFNEGKTHFIDGINALIDDILHN
ncbi:hypothetical protein DHW03_18505 [Pedobacter yonginense]|uniref:Uncharacterized protein n=1 Tax=Pedobacter yonginense TaxID=651869 RepID=A0A317EIW2_9SPHI|nr:hypothetical protein [Pedobacter yonginense]PWS26039.1 hypothetical protein DHW03_18505 [Pedobacter yonginense]